MSNSLSTTYHMWDPQLDAFATRYRILRYDQRGHGETEVASGPYSFEQLANDVLALLDALSITRTHFVGLSMGGMTGMTMAVRRAPVLQTLVLCDTASQDPYGDPALWQQRFDALRADGSMEVLVESALTRFLAPDTVKDRPQLAETVRAMIRNTSVDGHIACCQAIMELDLTRRLSEIAVPTMIVVGADDQSTTAKMSKTIHRNVAGSELVILKKAAHLCRPPSMTPFSASCRGSDARCRLSAAPRCLLAHLYVPYASAWPPRSSRPIITGPGNPTSGASTANVAWPDADHRLRNGQHG